MITLTLALLLAAAAPLPVATPAAPLPAATPAPPTAPPPPPINPTATPTATATGLPAGPFEAAVLALPEPAPVNVGIFPSRPFQGALVIIDVAGTDEVQKIRGKLGEKTIRWHKRGKKLWRGLAPAPDDLPAGTIRLSLEIEGREPNPAKPGKTRTFQKPLRWELPFDAVAFDSDELKVNPRFTKIPPEAKEKIAADKLALGEMWKKGSAPQPLFRKNFQKPRDDRTTAPYGTRRVFNGTQKSVHYGWDIDGNTGDPVACDNDGIVMLARDLYYSGNSLFLDHGGGLYTCYFHLDSITVAEGETVKRGQLCGKVGKTGRVTGPHLHWGLKLGGAYLHPELLLRFDWEKHLVQPPAPAPAPGPEGAAVPAPAVAP